MQISAGTIFDERKGVARINIMKQVVRIEVETYSGSRILVSVKPNYSMN
jgi:hypothetical protein